MRCTGGRRGGPSWRSGGPQSTPRRAPAAAAARVPLLRMQVGGCAHTPRPRNVEVELQASGAGFVDRCRHPPQVALQDSTLRSGRAKGGALMWVKLHPGGLKRSLQLYLPKDVSRRCPPSHSVASSRLAPGVAVLSFFAPAFSLIHSHGSAVVLSKGRGGCETRAGLVAGSPSGGLARAPLHHRLTASPA